MEIKTGSYTIKSDPLCCWIEQEVVQMKGKNIGKTTTKRVSGYFGKIEQLLPDFADKKFKSSDARTVEEALKRLAEAEKSMLALAAEEGRKLDERRKNNE